MTLREVTRTVISLVENSSGCPVVVSEDASLQTFAVSRIARGANKIHAISFTDWCCMRTPEQVKWDFVQQWKVFPKSSFR